jgi:hypothetical protein
MEDTEWGRGDGGLCGWGVGSKLGREQGAGGGRVWGAGTWSTAWGSTPGLVIQLCSGCHQDLVTICSTGKPLEESAVVPRGRMRQTRSSFTSNGHIKDYVSSFKQQDLNSEMFRISVCKTFSLTTVIHDKRKSCWWRDIPSSWTRDSIPPNQSILNVRPPNPRRALKTWQLKWQAGSKIYLGIQRLKNKEN